MGRAFGYQPPADQPSGCGCRTAYTSSRTRCGRMNGSASARKQSGTGHEGGTDSREEEAEVTHASPKKPRRKRKAKNQEERSGAADDATSKVVGEETVISSLAITLLNENDAGGPASPSANPQPVTVARRSDKPLEAFGTMEQESNAVVVPETQETPALAANVERAKEARGTAYGDMGVDEDVTTKESPSTVDLASSTRSSNDAGGAEDHDAHVTEARGGKASQAMNASQPEARPESEPEAGGQVAQCDDDQMLDASQTVSKVNADNAAVRQEEETLEPSSVMKARSARMRGKATAAVAVATVPQPFHVPGQCGICNKELSHSFESCEVIRAGRDAVQRRCQELKEKGRRKKVPERAAQKVLEQWLKSNIKNPQTQESTLDNTQMQETAVTAPKSIPTQKVSGTTQPQKDMTSLLDELGALRERASMAIKKGADLASKVQEGHHNGTPVSLYETTQAEVALRDAVQVKDSVNAPLEANPDLHTQERGVASPALSDRIKAAQIVLATTPDSQSATAAPLPAEASMRVSIADPKLAPLPGLRSPTGSDSSRELQTSPLLAPASAPPAEDEVETQAIDEPASPRKSSLAVPIGKGFEPEDSQADQIESDSSSQTSEDSDEEEEGIETDHEDVEEEEETEPEDAEAEDDILNADQGTDKQQLPNGHAQDGEGFSDSEIEEGDAEDMAEGLRSRSASPPPNQLGNHRNNEADGVAEGKEKESLRPAAVPEISQPFNPFRRSTRNGTSASQPTLAQRIIQTPFKRLSDLRPQHLRQSFSQPNSPVSAASTSTRIFPTGPATNAHDGVNGAATTPAKGGMDTANIPSTSGAESEAGEDSSESSSDSDSDSDSDEDVRKKKGKANASLCIPVSRLAGSSQNGKAKRRRSTFFKAFEG
ncbi:hypothetical protein K437DRAFT_258271 [Tilletiaria anomala UBC 951]|uniref:Uncharacterized protein n=1 Tax=Tilletiaria anomala (strain ATCC 24038 / CBS 436.72 / UBC 951) TaxID=1037660 RepID=A0A066VMD0_TILAU|nr:uncharacterized protein K437DRAFT_258271 [Tilletiaria anomala UBC 951]KDN41428.1 hypothetical protein K437DRAFT_258271 [Tilletiaria anomala UBC 951]